MKVISSVPTSRGIRPKEAGVEVELVWFDYLPSIDAFTAGKVDAVTAVGTDMLVTGASIGLGSSYDYATIAYRTG